MPNEINQPIRLLIADDHYMVRQGFQMVLKNEPRLEIIGEAGNGEELIELAGKLNPDIIVTDIQMPKLDGIEATKIINKKYPHIAIIAYTVFQIEYIIVKMLEAGARGYLTKNSLQEELFEAVEAVLDNKTYYCRSTTNHLANMIAKSKFTPRIKSEYIFNTKELEIIRMICEEKSNKEMALVMSLSVRTIEGYRDSIQNKMHVKNTAGIVVYAIRAGIFTVRYDI